MSPENVTTLQAVALATIAGYGFWEINRSHKHNRWVLLGLWVLWIITTI